LRFALLPPSGDLKSRFLCADEKFFNNSRGRQAAVFSELDRRLPPAARNRYNCWFTLISGGTSTAKQKKDKPSAKKTDDKNEKVIADNRKARHNYTVLDTLECGIVLVGSEVKSLRSGQLSLEEAYARVDKGEVWLVGCDIQEYRYSHQMNHVPKRRRKLLMHRREISKFADQAFEKNLTLVPLKMYFKDGRAKVLLGICKGKKLYDKRETMKKKDMQRDIDRAMRRG
jgi:SsrA-binding protein